MPAAIAAMSSVKVFVDFVIAIVLWLVRVGEVHQGSRVHPFRPSLPLPAV
jgi:hypothetical protein